MKNLKTIEKILLLTSVIVALILVAGLFDSSIYGNQVSKSPWLEQFVNGPVTVVFISAPPDSEKMVDARLISVEPSGLVLRIPKERIKFFPYANIVSVDPK
jgi:hypothetical protein